MFESGVNSYIDENGVQKIFETEIDFFIDYNYSQFFNYLLDLGGRSLFFLNFYIEFLKEKIEFLDSKDLLIACSEAGRTDFNLKLNQNWLEKAYKNKRPPDNKT